jgi:hypothetical protein
MEKTSSSGPWGANEFAERLFEARELLKEAGNILGKLNIYYPKIADEFGANVMCSKILRALSQ